MGSVAHYIEVNAPADQCYAWWRGLTNLPQIMPDVEAVVPKDGSTQVTHWKVHGPLGKTVEWDAKIVEDVPNTRIAWATEGSSGLDVKNAGAVRFDDHGGTTGVEVSLQYDPPGRPGIPSLNRREETPWEPLRTTSRSMHPPTSAMPGGAA